MKLKYSSWDNINIKTYKKLRSVIERTDAIDVEIGIIAILCDCSEEDVENLSISEYSRLREQAQWIGKQPESKAYCPKKIKLNQEYDVCYDISKLSVSQYIDFQNYIKMNENQEYMGHLLSVFLIPKGKTYGDYDIQEVIDDIEENMGLRNALDVCFFFTVEYLTLINLTLHYSESRIRKMVRKNKNPEIQEKLRQIRSMINGVGLTV